MLQHIVSLERSFTTSTSCFCPIQYARSCAWQSLWGFKSWSNLDPTSVTKMVFKHTLWRPMPATRINMRPPIKEKKFTPVFVDNKKMGIESLSVNLKCLPWTGEHVSLQVARSLHSIYLRTFRHSFHIDQAIVFLSFEHVVVRVSFLRSKGFSSESLGGDSRIVFPERWRVSRYIVRWSSIKSHPFNALRFCG